MLRLRISYRRLGLAVLVFCGFVTAATNALAQDSGSYRIAGKVISSTSAAPLSHALVTIASAQDRSNTTSVVTGPDGAFAFSGLPAGKYSLSAVRRGFIESSFDQHERYSSAIVTGGDADSEHLVFRLVPQAVLSGRVMDEAGEPVRRAHATLFRQDQSSGVTLIRQTNQTDTDDRGIFEFAELPAGNYFLSVDAKAWYALQPAAIQTQDGNAETPPAPAGFDVTYSTTYYPDTTDSSDATPIPLRGGEHLSADMHLSPVPALRIRVRLPDDPSGGFDMPQLLRKSFDSMENVTWQLLPHGSSDPVSAGVPPYTMPSPGIVELSGIPAGKYTVYIPNGPAGPKEGSLADIDLSRDGQEITPSSGEPVSSLNFKVRIAGDSRIPAQLALALQRADKTIAVASRVDEKGESEFVHIPPGHYNLIAATPTGDFAVTQITIDGSPNRGHGVDVVAGSSIEGTVTLVAGTGRVEGFAKRAGKGVPGVMVVLVPKNLEANGENLRRDQSDLDGRFTLTNVIPGEYSIVAIENGWDLNWSQPGVIAHYLENGHPVNVGPGLTSLSKPVTVHPR